MTLNDRMKCTIFDFRLHVRRNNVVYKIDLKRFGRETFQHAVYSTTNRTSGVWAMCHGARSATLTWSKQSRVLSDSLSRNWWHCQSLALP